MLQKDIRILGKIYSLKRMMNCCGLF